MIGFVAVPALLLGMYGNWHYPVFYELKVAFAVCLFAIALMSPHCFS